MSQKWYPPTPCPIERHMPGHYKNDARYYHPITYFSYRSPKYLFESNAQIPKTYYRLFAKRTSEKEERYQKASTLYAIYGADGRLIKSVKTKKQALKLLRKDYIWADKIKYFLDIGSFVVKIDSIGIGGFDDPVPVTAVKKCKGCCSNHCGCQLIAAIRYSAPKWRWWSKSEFKKWKKEDEECKKIIKISIWERLKKL